MAIQADSATEAAAREGQDPGEPESSAATAEPGAGKIGRLTGEVRGLVEDTKTWVDTKLRLFELEITERIDGVANRFVTGAVLAFVLGLALIFGLSAGALALGEWFDSTPLGFLAVAGLLVFTAVLIWWIRPKFVSGSIQIREEANRAGAIGPPVGRRQLPAGRNGSADA